MTTRYPLAWPPGWRRTPDYQRVRARFSRFKNALSVYDGINRVMRELQQFGVLEGDSIISTNIPTRLDGLPRSSLPEPADPGVCVYWKPGHELDKPMKCMAIDIYDRVADNLGAVAATLGAMRAIERHGGAQILERAFSGFDALPPPGGGSWTWREALGFNPRAKVTLAQVERSYRTLRSAAHPDRAGGSTDKFDRIQRAWEMAQQELA